MRRWPIRTPRSWLTLPEPITAAVLIQFFTPRADEVRWVWATSRSSEARLGLLCLLKAFPILGRFPAPEDIPDPIVEYIARRAGLAGLTLATYPKCTRARHRIQIRRHLGIHRWDAAAEPLASQTIKRIVGGRAHLSDLMLAQMVNYATQTSVSEGVTDMYLLSPNEPRRRSNIFAFVKFFENFEHAQQFLDGNLFMRRLAYFRREEDAEGRWDSSEGVFAWLQKKGLEIKIKLPNIGVADITERDLAAPVSMSLGETDNLYIFCLYAYYTQEPLLSDDPAEVYGDDRLAELESALHIDPKCLRFGSHAVVVPCVPFMERLKVAVADQALHVRSDLVRYYDNEILNGQFEPRDVPFRKQKRFDYQREYRICIRTMDRLAEPRTFNIGSLRQVGFYVPSEKVLKAFRLTLSGKAA